MTTEAAPQDQRQTAGGSGDGIYVQGTFLGSQAARTFTREGSGEVVNVRPRIGLDLDGEEVEVSCKDDEQLRETVKGLTRGQTIRLRVEVRPPYGARGAVTIALPGAIESRKRSWS